MGQVVEKIKDYIFTKILKKILIVAIIITNIFCFIPLTSFAEGDSEEYEEEEKYPALVPAYADAIISKFVSKEVSSVNGSTSSGSNGEAITDNSETGDGWDSITTVTYPNGTKRTFRNYKQYQGSYAEKDYYEGKIHYRGCAPTAVSIILSGYGIDANPGKVVDAIHEMGYDYSSMEIVQKALKKYNIDSEMESLTTSSIQHIRNNFKEGRPIITGVPHHFITYLGEDSNGDLILSDPGYTGTSYGKTLEDYVGEYGNRGFDLLLIKSDGNATASKSSTDTKKTSSSKSTQKASGSGEAKIEKCDPYNGGYASIFTSGTTGRQFKEYKQNLDGWDSKYIINDLVASSGWRTECGTVSIITAGSGYSEKANFDDVTSKMRASGGGTNFTSWLSDYSGQNVVTSQYNESDCVNKLSQGCVAVIHATSSQVSPVHGSHYMALLDISKDKSKVYLSNPWWGDPTSGWISVSELTSLQNDDIYYLTNNGDSINYSTGASVKQIAEDKIFYIGDSTMVGLNAYGVAKSPSSYFFAEGGRNADWVMSNYSSLKIPTDASCIVIEFGANGLDSGSENWKNTQKLVDKLAEDYSDKEIFVIQVAHICDGYTVDPDFNSKLDEYNEHMEEYCKGKNGVTYVNPTINVVSDNGKGYLKNEYAADASDTSMGGGKIHFNIDGYKVWYKDLIDCLKKQLPTSEQTQSIDMSKNIVLRDEKKPEKGYKINIDLDAEIDNFLEQLKEKEYHLENYLSSKNQKEYLKHMIKACIVTQYPDLRSASEIASDAHIPDNEAQGCIRIKRYADDETISFASGSLTGPIDGDDEDKGRYLSYMPYNDFSNMINDGDKKALNYFSMDSSNNIVVAGWETMDVNVEGPYQTDYTYGAAPSEYQVSYTPKQTPYSKLTMQKFNYLSQVSNYMMPFSLLWSLLVYGYNQKFVDDVAKLVIGTKIVIGSFDATNTRVTTNKENYEIEGTAYITINTENQSSQSPHATRGEELQPVSVTYKFEVVETDTLKTDTPNLKVIYANTWVAIYNNNYKLKTETKEGEEQTVELDDEILSTDWFLKKGDKYTGDRIPDNENLKEKIDKEIDESTEEILNKAIEEQRQAADKENAKIAYKYTALQEKVDKYYKDTNLGKFLSEKDVQSNVINMITNNYSIKQIQAIFSVENTLMVKYAKQYGLIPEVILNEATVAVVYTLQQDKDLYNAITKNGTDITLAAVYSSNIDSVNINTEKKKSNRKETKKEKETTTKVEEVPTTDDSNVTWKTSKSIFGEDSFVKLLTYNSEAKTNLLTINGWFFESMENTAAIADLEDLMKFLFQCVYDEDFGISDKDAEDLKALFVPTEVHNVSGTGSLESEDTKGIYNYLIGQGFTSAGAAGIMGNMEAESGFKSNCVQGWYLYGEDYNIEYTNKVNSKEISKNDFIYNGPNGGGYGIVQFTDPGKKTHLYENTIEKGKKIDDLQAQLDCLIDWLKEKESSLYNTLTTSNDLYTCAYEFLAKYEIPSYLNIDERYASAKKYFK